MFVKLDSWEDEGSVNYTLLRKKSFMNERNLHASAGKLLIVMANVDHIELHSYFMWPLNLSDGCHFVA